MDTLTQAALGAAIGGTVLGRRLGRKAVLLGAVLGTLPDLDVVIDYGDAISNYTQHRGFSHSLFLLAGLSTLLAGLCTRLSPARDISFRHWWLFFGLCLMTHPLLDTLTTYGTQIWWPSGASPSAWPIVFIIDPLYSLPLLVATVVALITGHGRRASAWGLALSCAYLLFSMGAKEVVETRIAPVLAAHELEDAPRLMQPTPFNVLLWRVTVIDGNAHHESLVGVFDGDHRPLLETYTRGAELEDVVSTLPKGQRLEWFASPFLRYDMRDIGDARVLVATDLRLGFPGFYPFSFVLAEAGPNNEWLPTVTYQLDTSRSDNGVALSRLFQRILDPEPPLCTSDFVDRRWVRSLPEVC